MINLHSSDFTFEADGVYIKDINKPGMLLIRSDYCIHCKRFQPTFQEIDKRINGDNFKLVEIERENMSPVLMRMLNINFFPTIKFFDKHGKIIGDYPPELDRNLETVVNFICKVYNHC